MKRAILLLTTGYLLTVSLVAQPLKPKTAPVPKGHYVSLAEASKRGNDPKADSLRFPLDEFRRLAYLKLRTHYLHDTPESFRLPAPPANSSPQTRAEIDSASSSANQTLLAFPPTYPTSRNL